MPLYYYQIHRSALYISVRQDFSQIPPVFSEKEIEADCFKRLNGLVIVLKKLETDIIQRYYHMDIREGHPDPNG
jgi:hypothetical protein